MPPKKHKGAHSDTHPTLSYTSSRPSPVTGATHRSSLFSSSSFSYARLSTATNDLWKSYCANTSNSLLIIDAFLVFLMYVGGVQSVYACLTGGYPFNSFLAGFSAAVGQFVLAGMTHCCSRANWKASLRSQVDKANRTEFPEISPERYSTPRNLVLTDQGICGFRV
jgi:hypothetical protein